MGYFQSTLLVPNENSTTIIASGGSRSISASNTNGNANYNLLANGVSIHTFTGSSYSYTDNNITANKNYENQFEAVADRRAEGKILAKGVVQKELGNDNVFPL